MREFAFGTDQQYGLLAYEISDGRCHVYKNCSLPDSCTPASCRLGFEKNGNGCIAYIDRGITTTSSDPRFAAFLQEGRAEFASMQDLAAFFRSLQPLFSPIEAPAEGTEPEVVDMSALVAEREQRERPKRTLLDPETISVPLKQKVFGQDAAIDALAQLFVLNQMRKRSKLLTAMILGPTATGKSETAKSLADVLTEATGTPYGYIELAGSEFVGEHSVHRFFGAPPGYVGHGQPTALDPVRQNPYHCIVINEVEKGDRKLIEGLMEAIDTGFVGMADNTQPIDLNHCILLFTSNLPINMVEYEAASDFRRSEMCRDAFTKYCGRPEISGKIGNFIVYRPLSVEAKARIIIKFIRQELDNYNLKLGTISRTLLHDFLDCETAYGARAIAQNVTNTVGRQAQHFLLHSGGMDALEGRTVSLSGSIDDIHFELS